MEVKFVGSPHRYLLRIQSWNLNIDTLTENVIILRSVAINIRILLLWLKENGRINS